MLTEKFGCRSVVRGENVKTVGNKLCGFMAKGEEAHITLKQCRSEDDLTYKEVPFPTSMFHVSSKCPEHKLCLLAL